MRVTVLGCGGSGGTPSVDFGWGKCDPDDPRNRRSRPSILVEEGETRLLVDTSPDLRDQLLRVGVNRLNAVFFTHSHADHLHGIDDLRPVNRVINAPLDAYGDAETLDAIRQRFGYVLKPLEPETAYYYKPVLIPHELRDGDRLRIGGIDVTAFKQDHGYCESMGFRFGAVAYSSDAVNLSDAVFEMLAGIEVWIIGTLLDTPHPTHAHVDKALEWIARVGARHGVLTHLSGRLDYGALAGALPKGVEPAFDGLVIETGGD